MSNTSPFILLRGWILLPNLFKERNKIKFLFNSSRYSLLSTLDSWFTFEHLNKVSNQTVQLPENSVSYDEQNAGITGKDCKDSKKSTNKIQKGLWKISGRFTMYEWLHIYFISVSSRHQKTSRSRISPLRAQVRFMIDQLKFEKKNVYLLIAYAYLLYLLAGF